MLEAISNLKKKKAKYRPTVSNHYDQFLLFLYQYDETGSG